MHDSMAVDACLWAMRLVSVYMLADAHEYSRRCMISGHAFGSCVYAGTKNGSRCMALGYAFGVCV